MRRLLLLFLIACNSDEFTGDGGADTGTDGVVSGGGDGGDAAIDAPLDVKKPRYCETVDARFCSDFDIEGDAGAGWNAQTETNGYTLTFENSQFKSAPNGVQVSIPADAGGMGELTTALGLNVDSGAMTSATFDADIYIPNLSVQTTQPIFMFGFGAVAPTYQYGLAHDGPVWKLEFLATKNGPQLTGTFATNEWAHVTLLVVLDSTAGYASLTITSSAGTATAAFPPGLVATVPPSSQGPYPIMFFIGAQSGVPPVTAAQVYYDNVVVHYQ